MALEDLDQSLGGGNRTLLADPAFSRLLMTNPGAVAQMLAASGQPPPDADATGDETPAHASASLGAALSGPTWGGLGEQGTTYNPQMPGTSQYAPGGGLGSLAGGAGEDLLTGSPHEGGVDLAPNMPQTHVDTTGQGYGGGSPTPESSALGGSWAGRAGDAMAASANTPSSLPPVPTLNWGNQSVGQALVGLLSKYGNQQPDVAALTNPPSAGTGVGTAPAPTAISAANAAPSQPGFGGGPMAGTGALAQPQAGQQGAAEEVPLPRPRPTPAAESPNAGGAVPEADTSKRPVEVAPATARPRSPNLVPVGGRPLDIRSPVQRREDEGKPTAKPQAHVGEAMDSLGKALAGLKDMRPPLPQVHTPAAPRPTGQPGRSPLQNALLQALVAATDKGAGPYRLSQALSTVGRR